MGVSDIRIDGVLLRQQIRFVNLAMLTKWIASLPEGTRIRANFEVTDLSRRERLEKFYFVVLRQAGDHFGNDPRDQHLQFWHALTMRHMQGSTLDHLHQLTDEDLSKYVQDCVRKAAEMGCVITERTP